MNIDLIKAKSIVTHSFDEESGKYTFSLLEKGGPIIISDTFEEGKVKMNEAFNCALSVRNLEYFDDISLSHRVSFKRSNATDNSNIEYKELQVA